MEYIAFCIVPGQVLFEKTMQKKLFIFENKTWLKIHYPWGQTGNRKKRYVENLVSLPLYTARKIPFLHSFPGNSNTHGDIQETEEKKLC